MRCLRPLCTRDRFAGSRRAAPRASPPSARPPARLHGRRCHRRRKDGPVPDRAAWVGEGLAPPGSAGRVDRADVAALLVACLEGQRRWGRALTITC
jgi:hypothetical protein